MQAVEQHTTVDAALRKACADLNRYYIPTRYPDAFPQGAPADQFFDADAQQALAAAEEVIAFATKLINPP